MGTRRNFLKLAGGAGLVVAAGGTAFSLTRTPTKALEPWRLAGSAYSEPRQKALSFGLLAPNPHNRQPWIADLSTPDEVVLMCDPDRRLPEPDPYDRQITIGLGCFIELTRLAAAADGWAVDVDPFPDGQPEPRLDARPVARLRFEPTAPAIDPLFDQALNRRSSKVSYDTKRPVSKTVADALVSVTQEADARTVLDAKRVETLRQLTFDAHMVEITTPRTYQESIDLMRIGKAEIEKNPDGIEIGGAFMEALAIAGLLTKETLADPNSQAFQSGASMFEEMMMTAMGYVFIATDGNTRRDQLQSGYDWVRINLRATELGLGLHPHSQALQEFAEMAPLYKQLHELLVPPAPPNDVDAPLALHHPLPGKRLQMLGRIGYCAPPQPTPRWKLETRLMGT